MSGEHDTGPVRRNADQDASGELDPRTAAEILERSERRARHELSFISPVLSLVFAGVFLVGYGGIWWSVRGQTPYTGPTPASLAVLYGLIVVAIVVTLAVYQRATDGVSGRSSSRRRAAGVAVAAAYLSVYLLQGALYYNGVGASIVYGVYAAAAPLMVLGATYAGIEAGRENRRGLTLAVVGMVVASASAFAGPVGVWGVIAVAAALALVGHAAITVVTTRSWW